MKGFVAAVIAAIFSLFGIHPAPAHTVVTLRSAQVASAVSAVEDPFHHASNDPGTSTRQSATIDSTPSPQTTVVKQYITQPVIERIIQSPPFASGRVLGAFADDTAAKLADLQNQINALANVPRSVFVPTFSGPAATTPSARPSRNPKKSTSSPARLSQTFPYRAYRVSLILIFLIVLPRQITCRSREVHSRAISS